MNKEDLKKQNIKNIFRGYSFEVVAGVLIAFFLPYYLKEMGFSILEIGTIFTIAVGFGGLIYGLLFSKALKKMKLRTSLIISGIIGTIKNFIFPIFPSSSGIITGKATTQIHNLTKEISSNVALQHNLRKRNERKISSIKMMIDTGGISLGIILSIILIKYTDFNLAFVLFGILSLFSLIFYKRIKDETRFLSKVRKKRFPINNKAKLTITSYALYILALQSSFALVITFLVKEMFNDSLEILGLIFLLLYIPMTITTLISRRKLNKKNYVKTAIFGMTIILISSLIIVFSKNPLIVLLAFVVEGIGGGIWEPSANAMLWQFTEKENREKISGLSSGIYKVMVALGPLIGAIIVSQTNVTGPFAFKAILTIISIGIYFLILKIKD